ncbi:MAG: hypothetical protein WC479_06420 [Candidatus Izemoplasmatales bacterium]
MQYIIRLKGGAGSGNHGHKGIPGHRGGSLPKDDQNFGNSNVSSKLEIVNGTVSEAKKLNVEWDKTYNVRTGGPFWDMNGELNPKYYIIRDSENKLIAGATTRQRGFGTEIVSIESKQAGEGIKLLDKLKQNNIFLYAFSSSKNSDNWYEKFGFIRDNNHPDQYNYVWKRGNND